MVEALATFVCEQILWAGYHRLHKGGGLPASRNFSEEQVIESGYGWCNEQARVFCCLTQLCGLPSRLVFGSHREKG